MNSLEGSSYLPAPSTGKSEEVCEKPAWIMNLIQSGSNTEPVHKEVATNEGHDITQQRVDAVVHDDE